MTIWFYFQTGGDGTQEGKLILDREQFCDALTILLDKGTKEEVTVVKNFLFATEKHKMNSMTFRYDSKGSIQVIFSNSSICLLKVVSPDTMPIWGCLPWPFE